MDTCSNDEKILLVGDFNAQTTDHYLSLFFYQHELWSMVEESMYLKIFQHTITVSCEF